MKGGRQRGDVLVDEPAFFRGEGDFFSSFFYSIHSLEMINLSSFPTVVTNLGVTFAGFFFFFLRVHRIFPGKTLAFMLTIIFIKMASFSCNSRQETGRNTD